MKGKQGSTRAGDVPSREGLWPEKACRRPEGAPQAEFGKVILSRQRVCIDRRRHVRIDVSEALPHVSQRMAVEAGCLRKLETPEQQGYALTRSRSGLPSIRFVNRGFTKTTFLNSRSTCSSRLQPVRGSCFRCVCTLRPAGDDPLCWKRCLVIAMQRVNSLCCARRRDSERGRHARSVPECPGEPCLVSTWPALRIWRS